MSAWSSNVEADIGKEITPRQSARSNGLSIGLQSGSPLGRISFVMPLLAREYNLSRSCYDCKVAGLAVACTITHRLYGCYSKSLEFGHR